MQKLQTKIFIDGGAVEETTKANEAFVAHFDYSLDGQTTNPSLIAKNLQAQMEQEGNSGKLTSELALEEYKKIVQAISMLLPHGSVSIQVFANDQTLSEEMVTQARERITWIPNASIKLPCTTEGLKAAEILCKDMPLNITLVFSQSQAAAVYEATKKTQYPVFLSPFVGRLDDRGESGMDIIANILKLYASGDGHVQTLAASIRNLDHILYSLKLQSPIMTIPYKTFLIWQEGGFQTPSDEYVYKANSLKPIPYDESVTLGKNWQEYNLSHELTTKGLAAFWSDWTSLFAA